jgi:hypothetical protein
MNCDQAFDCLTDPQRRAAPELARHLDACPRCRQMAETLSPAIEMLSGPVPPWMMAEPTTRTAAPTALSTVVAQKTARQLGRRRISRHWTWSAYALSAACGAAVALMAIAVVPKTTSTATAQPVCTWKDPSSVKSQDAQAVALSCIVCHFDRGR